MRKDKRTKKRKEEEQDREGGMETMDGSAAGKKKNKTIESKDGRVDGHGQEGGGTGKDGTEEDQQRAVEKIYVFFNDG